MTLDFYIIYLVLVGCVQCSCRVPCVPSTAILRSLFYFWIDLRISSWFFGSLDSEGCGINFKKISQWADLEKNKIHLVLQLFLLIKQHLIPTNRLRDSYDEQFRSLLTKKKFKHTSKSKWKWTFEKEKNFLRKSANRNKSFGELFAYGLPFNIWNWLLSELEKGSEMT